MITYEVRVCIGQDNPEKHIAVKCHDTGVNLMVYLQVCRPGKWRDETEPYWIPAGTTPVIKVAKPDKTYCVCDGELVSGGILFRMKPEAFTAAGVSHAEVSLFGADTRRLTSATFDIHVLAECVCEGEKESESYVDVMGKQIQAAIDAAETAMAAADKASAAAVHQPTISGAGTWLVWDTEQGEYVDTGVAVQGGGDGSAVLYTAQNLTPAQQKQARENIDVAGYNVVPYLWPTEHSGRENTDITTLLDNDVYMGIVRNSTAFPSPGLVMLQGPMAGNVYTAVLLAKDGLTYTATFQYVRSTRYFTVLTPLATASSKVMSVKLTQSEADENVYTADRNISEIKEALQAGHMALAYTPDAIGVYNSVSLITDCYRLASSASYLVTLLDCTQFGIVASHLITGEDGVTWTMDGITEYAISGRVTDLENAMPHPVDKTDTMTQAVGRDEEGKLWTQPGAGGGSAETWELIASGAVDEVANLSITQNADGTALALKSCCILIDGALSGNKGQYICFRAARYVSGKDYDRYDAEVLIAKDNPSVRAAYVCEYGKPPIVYMDSGKGSVLWQVTDAAVCFGIHRNYASGYDFTPTQHTLNQVWVGKNQSNGQLGAGCKYALWGVRA